MNDRRAMTWTDWLNAGGLAAVGLFLGIALHLMTQLSAAAFWPVLIISIVGFFGVIAFDRVLDWVSERIFSGKIRAGKHTKPKGRRPLAMLLAVPFGLLVGFSLSWLGYGDAILGAMP
jgi:FtsH-binding integral membrane protein